MSQGRVWRMLAALRSIGNVLDTAGQVFVRAWTALRFCVVCAPGTNKAVVLGTKHQRLPPARGSEAVYAPLFC